MYKVAIVGTFDVENYGDLLFPLVAKSELERHLGAVELIPFSYKKKVADTWCYDVECLSNFEHRMHEFDAVIIGGGHLIRFDKFIAEDYLPNDERIHHPCGYWLAPALAAGLNTIPVVFNAPGATETVPAWAAAYVCAALEYLSYASVRDVLSETVVRETGFRGRCDVVPDTIFGIANTVIEPEAIVQPLLSNAGINRPYLILQPNQTLDDIAVWLREERISDYYDILLLPAGPSLGDNSETFQRKLPEAIQFAKWPSPIEIASLIAKSRGVISVSMHMSITALAFGVPSLRKERIVGKCEILDNYDDVFFFDGQNSTESFLNRIKSGAIEVNLKNNRSKLDAHWQCIAQVIEKSKRRFSPRQTYFAWNSLLRSAEQQNNQYRSQISHLEENLRSSNSIIDGMHAQAASLDDELGKTREELARARDEICKTKALLEEAYRDLAVFQDEMEQLNEYEQALNRILNSKSWRITTPLREVSAKLSNFGNR